MIAQECKKLKNQLEEVAKAIERENVVKQLEEPQQELRSIRDNVLTVKRLLVALAKRTPIVGKIDGSKSLDRVQKLRQALAEDATSLTRGSNLTYTKKAFEKFAEQIVEAAAATWEQYKPKAQPTVDANQIAQADQQEAYRRTVSQLKASVKQAEQTGRNVPRSEAEFVELENTWKHIRELIEALPAASDNPDVQRFLRAANSADGASLELLNEAVRKWLDENNSSGKYRIHNA